MDKLYALMFLFFMLVSVLAVDGVQREKRDAEKCAETNTSMIDFGDAGSYYCSRLTNASYKGSIIGIYDDRVSQCNNTKVKRKCCNSCRIVMDEVNAETEKTTKSVTTTAKPTTKITTDNIAVVVKPKIEINPSRRGLQPWKKITYRNKSLKMSNSKIARNKWPNNIL